MLLYIITGGLTIHSFFYLKYLKNKFSSYSFNNSYNENEAVRFFQNMNNYDFCIGLPICEELIFRLIPICITNYFNILKYPLFIFSSLIFGFGHYIEFSLKYIIKIIFMIFSGLVLWIVTEYNPLYGILLHILWNSFWVFIIRYIVKYIILKK